MQQVNKAFGNMVKQTLALTGTQKQLISQSCPHQEAKTISVNERRMASTQWTEYADTDFKGRRTTKKVKTNGEIALHLRYIYRGYPQIVACDRASEGSPNLWHIPCGIRPNPSPPVRWTFRKTAPLVPTLRKPAIGGLVKQIREQVADCECVKNYNR